MIWDDVRGRSDQVEMFRRSIRRGRLASGYLFAGPDGVGKRLFARRLAQCLFCERIPDADVDACGECGNCRQMKAGSHPDLLSVARPEGKREIPIEAFVGTRERRGREGLCYDLSLRPMSSERKIAVIDDASSMTDESANALLKTLEEPPPYAMLILLAANPDGLLTTIRSRCQLVRFPPLAESDLAELLLARGMASDAGEASAVAALSDGSLATAAQLLDPQLRGLRDRLYAALSAERFHSVQTAKEVVAAIEELGGDAATHRRNAGWMIRFAVELFHSVLRLDSNPAGNDATIPQARRLEGRYDPETTMQVIDRFGAAAEQLDQIMPVPLCVEGLFDEVGRLLRQANPMQRVKA